jgi:hypothetical protein
MAETAPRTNPRLENFEANKAAQERDKFESELYAEAGSTDFSDEARNRVEEADAYERHMEEMAKRERTPLNDDNSADAIRARISATYNFDAEHPESRAYNQEWDDAIAENEARDAKKVAEDEALVAKFAEKGSGNLRLMDRISKEIHELRNKAVDPETDDEDARRLDELENRLQELLERYSESEDYDPAIADMMIDRDDTAAVRRAAEQALAEREGRELAEKEKNLIKDPTEARLLAEVERLSRAIKSNPEEAKKAELYDKVEELLGEIEAAIAAAKKSEEELKTPKDAKSDDEEIKSPKDSDEEEIKTPKDAKSDDEEIKTPKDAKSDDEEEIKTPKDAKSDEEEIKTPKDAKSDDEEKDGKKEEERISGWRHPFAYVGALFTVRGGSLMERFRSTDKKKVIAVAGAVAVVGSIIAWRLGAFGHGGGGGGGHQAQDFTPGQKGGHPGGDGHIDTPPPTPKATPEIPSGDAYAHPWNWMKAAMENGSIKAPTGMGPEQALHHYGELAEAAGHKVEWYNLPNGLEAIRIDGSDDTAYIGDVIGQVAK